MKKIKEILIGTNNIGKYREFCALLPKRVKKYSPIEFNILNFLREYLIILLGKRAHISLYFP